MRREVEQCRRGLRLVAVGIGDQRPGVVRDHQLRHALDVFERTHESLDPVGERLARRGAGERVARGTERGDEDLRALTGLTVGDALAGVVDEQLLAGAVDLAHRTAQARHEVAVALRELRVLVRRLARVRRDVLLPQQPQRHAPALELLMDRGVVGLHVPGGIDRVGRNRRASVVLAHRKQLGRRQLRRLGVRDVLGDDALRDRQRPRDPLVRKARLVLQSIQLADAAHGQCPGRHRLSGWQNRSGYACKTPHHRRRSGRP